MRYAVFGDVPKLVIDQWVDFVVNPVGTLAWCNMSDPRWWDDAAELFIGPVFSAVLSQRGQTCLHAALVEIEGRCLGFIGASGDGKSTTTLAFVQRGAHLVSDDVAVLTEAGGAPAVWPGLPRLRAHRAPAASVGADFGTLGPMWSVEVVRDEKRYVDLAPTTPAWADAPLPLEALYFLMPRRNNGAPPYVRPVPPLEAVARLMANRHMPELVNPHNQARDFATLSRVATGARMYELHRPDDLNALDQCVDVVLADAIAG